MILLCMPTIYVDEDVFAKYVKAYGYENAKKEITKVVKEHAPE